MAQDGFLIKLGAKKTKPRRGYAVAFDYDDWTYAINNEKKRNLPKGIRKIVIEVESD